MTKMLVSAKAQNRTALGIVHAYMALHPETTLRELRAAFPNDICPDKGVSENFILNSARDEYDGWNGYFRGDDEVLTMGDGKEVVMNSMWTKPSYDRIVKLARRYGIAVQHVDKLPAGTPGGFILLAAEPSAPQQSAPKKKISLQTIITIVVGIASLLVAYFWLYE